MAVGSSAIGAATGIISTLWGRNREPMTRNPTGQAVASMALSWASMGIMPLILSMRGPKKVYDPLKNLKRMQELIEKNNVRHKDFHRHEADFARKRMGRLGAEVAAAPFSKRAAKSIDQILMHHQIFGDLTAREVLKSVAPRTLKSAQVGKPRFGFVEAGTRHKKLSLAAKVARLDQHPPRTVPPGAPRLFTDEEIKEEFRRSKIRLTGGMVDGVQYPPLSSVHVHNRQRLLDERFWGPGEHGHTPEELIAKESARQAIATRSPAPVATETVTPPFTDPGLGELGADLQAEYDRGGFIIDDFSRNGEPDMSLTGVDTSFWNTLNTGLEGLAGTFNTVGPMIASIIAATQGGGGGAPGRSAGVPQEVAVLPGGSPVTVNGNGAYPVGLTNGIDLPFIDIMPQGSSGITSPFHTTAAGNQVAQPFVKSKSNGKTEWFIPAGQPKTWTKASRKRSHRHAHHHPR